MSTNKILLVDDEPNVRETIKELLVFKNYDVRTAANGQEALELLEYWIPDLILCDMVMPVMNGSELHESIKNNKSLSPIPFIFLSAKNEIDLIQKCLLDGADGFLTKPFKINELTLIVAAGLARFENNKNIKGNLQLGKKKRLSQLS
ncbi:response regulator [Flavobacterium chungbukense]|uniref:Response regulatory domain-containing protein n=1 Tax=Flavobacterium chungbukense TaxID=877464 RepID=A0ABP7Y6V7_9FLAO|nr:response regulator [Flavobacterium chungbukense]MCC4923769.1 response regulator [Flavobacterium chungbukense]